MAVEREAADLADRDVQGGTARRDIRSTRAGNGGDLAVGIDAAHAPVAAVREPQAAVGREHHRGDTGDTRRGSRSAVTRIARLTVTGDRGGDPVGTDTADPTGVRDVDIVAMRQYRRRVHEIQGGTVRTVRGMRAATGERIDVLRGRMACSEPGHARDDQATPGPAPARGKK